MERNTPRVAADSDGAEPGHRVRLGKESRRATDSERAVRSQQFISSDANTRAIGQLGFDFVDLARIDA